MEVTGGVDKVTWERSAHRAAGMPSAKFPVITVIAACSSPLAWNSSGNKKAPSGRPGGRVSCPDTTLW